MTVPATPAVVSYNGPSTSPLAIPFYFLENSHIYVVKTNTDATQVVLALTTDYTVTGALNESGGELTLVTELIADESVEITLSIPIEQLTDYLRNDPFPAESTEQALDKITMILKSLVRLAPLSVGINGDSYTTNIYGQKELPTPILDYYLHVNAVTNKIEWRPVAFSALRKLRTLTSAAGVITIDVSLSDSVYRCTLFEDITDVVLLNLPPVGSVVEFTIEFYQDGTGGWTYTPPGFVTHSGGAVALSTAPNAEDHIGYRVDSDGNMKGYPALAFA